MPKKKPYNRDSLERALIHHGIDYGPPHVGKPTWRLTTGSAVGTVYWPEAMVYAFVVGLATKEQTNG